MALIMEIMQTIAQPISELAIWFEETYQVDSSETIAKWHELTGMNITVVGKEVSHDEVQSLDVDPTKIHKSKKIPRTKSKDICQHLFLSGKKIGEQCTTKPKGGASYCSAHKPKDSVTKDSVKAPKKKEIKKIEKIDSDFGSDVEDEKILKIKSKKKVPKEPKKVEKLDDELITEIEANDYSDDGDDSEPQKPVKPLLKKKVKKGQVKPSKKQYDTDEEILDKNLNLSDDD
jgi:hypothetical protein